MSFSFANPALLFGALLFVVPLIIHLLNRRRYHPIRWAAQEFLRLAYQRTRRRLTLESLLLLLARCSLIALLALALARPFVPSSDPLAVFTAAQRNVVLVADVSYSMTRRGAGGDSALSRAKEQMIQLVDQLSAERGDRVGLLTLGARPQQLLAESTRLDLARDAVLRIEPDWRRADLQRTLEALDELFLAPASGHREVFVFTDLQRLTFDPAADTRTASDAAEALPAAALRRVGARDATLTIVDVGDTAASRNLAVESLEPEPRNVVKGEVVTFTATVVNFSGAQQQGVVGTFVLNGRREQAKASTFDVPARGNATVEFSTVLAEAGFATVEFELLEDELAADDRRFLAFPVRDSVSVLIVDGLYDRGEDLRASAQLERVLDPDRDPENPASIFRIARVIDDRRFNLGAENPADYDLIVLADVPRIDEKIGRELERAVRAGAGLLIFLGEQVDAASWNARLWRDDGGGLLPAKLVAPSEERADVGTAWRPRIDNLDHPIMQLFRAGALAQGFKEAAVTRFMRVQIGPQDVATAHVLDLDDDRAASSPLMLEKPAGHGRVVLVTTSADASWGRLFQGNAVGVFLPLAHEIAAWLTLPDLGEFNVGVGDRLRRSVRAIPSSIAVLTPAGERVPLEASFEQQENGRYVLPAFDRTLEPGAYALELEFPLASRSGADAGSRETVRYSVNVDTAESDPARLDEQSLENLYPGAPVRLIERIEQHKKEADTAREGELWRSLLWVVLALLGAEMALATWFGRRSLGGGGGAGAGGGGRGAMQGVRP